MLLVSLFPILNHWYKQVWLCPIDVGELEESGSCEKAFLNLKKSLAEPCLT